MILKYRREIDGLRAIAVLPVVLNHAKIPPFSGGFIGVDIFFVISGFLISSILYNQITAGSFSILDFYERRARRIVPALSVVVAASFVVAYFTMLPDDFENFSQSVVATMFFSNNILLTMTSGYWELASEFKPLLHTWSLAVEEQFYLIYPIILIFLLKKKNCPFGLFLVITAAISFSLSSLMTAYYPNSSFYLIHTRAWELLTGAIAAFYSDRINVSEKYKNYLSLIGMIVIVFSIIFYNDTTPYPSFYAALPCIGTALILLFATKGTLINSLLSTRPFVGIGLISYSIYLWHQPLFSFARILSVSPPSLTLMACLCIITLVVSYLSWRYVEKPFRDRENVSRNMIFIYSGFASVSLAAISLVVFIFSGLPNRVPGIGLEHGHYISYNERVFDYKNKKFSDDGRPRLLVIGNSTARDFVNVMLESKRFLGYNIIYRDDISVCDNKSNDKDSLELISASDGVIAVSNFKYDNECHSIDWRNPIFAKKPLVVVGPKHFGYNLNVYMHISNMQRPEVRATQIPETLLANAMYKRMVPVDHYVDLLAIMDRRYGGVPVFDKTGKILSADRVHLTQAGARLFAGFAFADPAWIPIFQMGRAKGS